MGFIKKLEARVSEGLLKTVVHPCTNQNRIIIQHLQNNWLISQGLARETEQYRIAYKLHKAIHIENVDKGDCCLRRIGRNNDGGYVMHTNLSKNHVLYSFGIADDVSYEMEMANEYGYECYMYDHTISGLPEDNKLFHWAKTGIAGEIESHDLKFLESLIADNGHKGLSGMILKMDVEGAEWEFLKHTPSEVLSNFDQIVMEIHGLLNPQNTENIIEAIDKIRQTHLIFHVHANSLAPLWVTDDLVTPDVIEISMIKRNLVDTNNNIIIFPIPGIDEPTVAFDEDISLGKWNV